MFDLIFSLAFAVQYALHKQCKLPSTVYVCFGTRTRKGLLCLGVFVVEFGGLSSARTGSGLVRCPQCPFRCEACTL